MKIGVISFRDFKRYGGTSIRTLGYTNNNYKDVEIDFFSSAKVPDDLAQKVHVKYFSYFNLLDKLLLFYCAFPQVLSVFRFIIDRFEIVKRLKCENKPLIFHQNFKLGMYLARNYKKTCIYDIHGLMVLQDAKYKRIIHFKDNLLRFLKLRGEKNYFSTQTYFNAISPEMKHYLIKHYNSDPENILIARDGTSLPWYSRNLEKIEALKSVYKKNDIMIMFFGSFKTWGGVFDLVKAFYLLSTRKDNVRLFLGGTGEDYEKVVRFITDKQLTDVVKLIDKVPYSHLINYYCMADVLVCPDRKTLNNEITPHVKVFDTLASGRPVVLSRFKCLDFLSDEFQGIEFFEPSNVRDLAKKLVKVLDNYEKYKILAQPNKEKIKKYTYQKISQRYYHELKEVIAKE